MSGQSSPICSSLMSSPSGAIKKALPVNQTARNTLSSSDYRALNKLECATHGPSHAPSHVLPVSYMVRNISTRGQCVCRAEPVIARAAERKEKMRSLQQRDHSRHGSFGSHAIGTYTKPLHTGKPTSKRSAGNLPERERTIILHEQ